MSYSSIIRESEDFGCVICDEQGRQLCESTQSTPLQSGPIPGYIAGINRRFAELGVEWKPGRRRHPQPRLLRRLASARRRVRRPGLPRGRARRLLGDDRAPPRPRRAHARAAAASSTRPTPTPRGCSSTRSRSRRRAAATTSVWQILRDNPRAAARRRRHGGAGRRRKIGAGALPRADRALRPGDGAGRPPRTSWTTPSGCCAARSRSCRTARTRPRATRRLRRPSRPATGTSRSRSRVTVNGSEITST